MNELFFAYALGAFLGGVTVFSFLYSMILNLKSDLFIREKQLNLYTMDQCKEEKVTEISHTTSNRAEAYKLYTVAYGNAVKQVLEALIKEEKKKEREESR